MFSHFRQNTVACRKPPEPVPAYNALTIDVEDWYHVCGIPSQPVPPSESWRVTRNINKILSLLQQYECRATFFILGSVAASLPALAPLIAAQGHEIASHGYSHTLLSDMNEEQFRDELVRTGEILFEQTGQRPVGYRAPQWSVSPQTPWVDTVLSEYGYLYDSSRIPLCFIGDASATGLPFRITTAHGQLWEIPPLVTRTPLVNLPTGGGWGFRTFPLSLIAATIMRYHQAAAPAVLYLHPREVDPAGPRLKLSLFKRFLSYGTRSDATPRLISLLQRFQFTTVKDIIRTWQTQTVS